MINWLSKFSLFYKESKKNLVSFFGKVSNYITWTFTRTLSELQILTKVSYLMLILVPILAALWPGVRMAGNQYNYAAERLTSVMNTSYQALQKQSQEILSALEKHEVEESTRSLRASLQEITHQVNQFNQDVKPRTIEDPLLPWTWAAAFFAALFSVIGHLIYQLFAPDIIRKYTQKEYISFQKKEYAEYSATETLDFFSEQIGIKDNEISVTRPDIERFSRLKVIEFIKELSNYPLHEIQNLYEQVKENIAYIKEKQGGIAVVHDELIRDLHFFKKLENKLNTFIFNDDTGYKLSIIEKGAKQHYVKYSQTKKLAIIFSSVFYMLAILIIFKIVAMQISLVMQAAGWMNMSVLFPLF